MSDITINKPDTYKKPLFKKKTRVIFKKILGYFVLTAIAFVFMIPLLWMMWRMILKSKCSSLPATAVPFQPVRISRNPNSAARRPTGPT